jgi:predicted RNase H-like HicB family nuclease
MTDIIKSKQNRADEIMSKPYTRRIVPDEEGGYVGSILEFPGCFAEGESGGEVMERLNEAARSWIEAALETGYEIREPVSFEGCSGKIALRIPRNLHKQVAELAELEETSVNQLILTAISAYVGSKKTFETTRSQLVMEIRNAIRDSLVRLYQDTPLVIKIELPAGERAQHGLTIPLHRNVASRKTFAFQS